MFSVWCLLKEYKSTLKQKDPPKTFFNGPPATVKSCKSDGFMSFYHTSVDPVHTPT